MPTICRISKAAHETSSTGSTSDNYRIVTAGLGAALSGDPMGMPVDWDLEEARQHLHNYIELVLKIESITHGREIAQARFEQRVQQFVIGKANYDVRVSSDTIKTNDYFPWTWDDSLREGARCSFDGLRLNCD